MYTPGQQQQAQPPQADRAHPHPAWNNLQRLAHYRNRRMQRLHVMGGRGRVVFLHGNGGPNNNNQNQNRENNNNNNDAHPFDIIVEQHHQDPQEQQQQQRPGDPLAQHAHRLWNFLEDDHLLDDHRHLAGQNNLEDDDIDDIDDDIDDDDDLEMEFML